MNQELISAKRMLETLLATPILNSAHPGSMLKNFEASYCFDPEIQPMFSAAYLRKIMKEMKRETLYELRDALEVSMILFYLGDDFMIIGPYATNDWDDQKAAQLLSTLGVTAKFFMPYKRYRSQFTVLNSGFVIRGASALIDMAEVEDSDHPRIYTYEKITYDHHHQGKDESLELNNCETINLHYIIEDQLMKAIESGNEAAALNALSKLSALPQPMRYLWSQASGSSSLRTLIRLAAKRSGLPPISIDSISLSYAQKMHQAVNFLGGTRVRELSREMVSEICKKIHQYNSQNYSALIRKAISFIELNISKPLTTAALAEALDVSIGYLSKRFRQETGDTITQFIMKQRAERAAHLLTTSKQSIQDISAYVGYLDNNYFVKIFKSQCGMTPTEYRKRHSF